ncbi:MAG TPA: NAD(P)/FAD-dependent oxidoreductase [Euzebyales bacterium]|nr:NAD(P)/FAD-dependent oxidoreductase [Euzebyales bacterium]
MTKALIIGAGVAGPVAAMALQRAGVDAEIFEAHPRTADDVGAFLTLQTNGMDALRAIDAYRPVAGRGFATPVMQFYSWTGKHLGTVPTGGVLDDGTVGHTVRRTDLYTALRDEAVRRGVRIHHGRRLVDAREHAGGAIAEFEDGSTAAGDLLVGCDGVRSRVRTVIDPDVPAARRVPLLNLGGYARGVATDKRPGEYHMIFGKRAFFGYAPAPDGETWWFANPPAREDPGHEALASTTDTQWRTMLRDLYAVDRSPAVDLIDATPGPLRGYATYDFPTIPIWHNPSMVVIGDAAHAVSPSSGQGASMAIEDAVQLARCVRDLPTIPAALETYEQLRRARVERVVAVGARSTSDKVAGPVARVFRDLLMPLFLRRVAGNGASSLAWMHRYHVDWDARVVPGAAARAASTGV